MRRVPSRLLFAAFALSLSPLTSGGVLAEPGFRHGAAAHGRAFGGWHGSAPRHGAFHSRGFARSGPAFGSYGHHARRFGFHDFRRGGSPFYGHGRVLHASPFYGPYSYGRVFFGHHGYGSGVYGHHGFDRHVYGQHGYGRLGYGHHGYGRIGYGHHGYGRIGYGHHGYGGHFYGRGGYGHDGYGRRGYGFFPHSTWVWPSDRYVEPVVALASAPHPALAGIPSVADLPVSLGIRSTPAASPAIYVVGSGTGSLRSGGVEVVSAERGGSENKAAGSGPRIIRLDAPRGR